LLERTALQTLPGTYRGTALPTLGGLSRHRELNGSAAPGKPVRYKGGQVSTSISSAGMKKILCNAADILKILTGLFTTSSF
jgi:hypothetical protein